ncbi:hypothetical protein ACGO3R_08330 [Lactococcus lactis]
MKDFKADETFKATSALNLSMMYRDSPNYPVKNSWMLWSELEKIKTSLSKEQIFLYLITHKNVRL